ncbi:MAG: PHP domain-containing protein [Candidatus Marinimicrobia bacterium]|nr:PHP domain-containing protein [Candidatus Neomarinimicrobiota bacterium]
MIRFKTSSTAFYADLHLHSTASDGQFSPVAVAQKLIRKGVMAASLTDHDTVNGFAPFQKKFRGIAVPGMELSVLHEGTDFHLLGYGFDPGNPRLNERLGYYRKIRHERMGKMVAKLQHLGLPIRREEVEKELGAATAAGRPHIARVLVARGWVKSVSEAFNTYLDYDKPAYVPKARMSFDEGLELIHAAKGIAVLAHPGKSSPDGPTPLLNHPDLDGIEVWHPDHNGEMSEQLLEIAAANGQIPTGGSDFHGTRPGVQSSLGEFGLDIRRWMDFKETLKKRETFIAPYL